MLKCYLGSIVLKYTTWINFPFHFDFFTVGTRNCSLTYLAHVAFPWDRAGLVLHFRTQLLVLSAELSYTWRSMLLDKKQWFSNCGSWNTFLCQTQWISSWRGWSGASNRCFHDLSRGWFENHGYRSKFTTNVPNYLKSFSNRIMPWPCNNLVLGLTAPHIP